MRGPVRQQSAGSITFAPSFTNLPALKYCRPVCSRPVFAALNGCWLLLLLAAAGCSSGGHPAASLPTGHYEGPVTYQGNEMRAVLDLWESQPGQLEADLSFPEVPGLGFAAQQPRFNAPMLHVEQRLGSPDNLVLDAIREGDFWRGSLISGATTAEILLVRRGKAQERPYGRETVTLRAGSQAGSALLLVPDDTLRHAAVVLVPDATADLSRTADLLARQGFAALLLPTPAPATPDSVVRELVQAAQAALRAVATVDSGRVGWWAAGVANQQLLSGGRGASPRPAFMVLQAPALASNADQLPFRQLVQQRVPTLALYGAADTLVNARESARRLRTALGYRNGGTVRIYAGANHNLFLPGTSQADGKSEWLRPAPDYITDLLTWLKGR